MIMSGSSLIHLEDVAAASPAALFQAYLPGDDSAIEALRQGVDWWISIAVLHGTF